MNIHQKMSELFFFDLWNILFHMFITSCSNLTLRSRHISSERAWVFLENAPRLKSAQECPYIDNCMERERYVVYGEARWPTRFRHNCSTILGLQWYRACAESPTLDLFGGNKRIPVAYHNAATHWFNEAASELAQRTFESCSSSSPNTSLVWIKSSKLCGHRCASNTPT